MSIELDARTRAALAYAALQPCLLCGRQARYAAVFVPDAHPDRRAFYSLCDRCFARTDHAEAVEARILGPAR